MSPRKPNSELPPSTILPGLNADTEQFPPELAMVNAPVELQSAGSENEDVHQEIARIRKEMSILKEALRKSISGHSENCSPSCTCAVEEFKPINRRSHIEAAGMYLNTAKERANQDKHEKEARKNSIIYALNEMIADPSYLAPKSFNGLNDSMVRKSVATLVDSLTEEIMSMREPTTRDIRVLFDARRNELRAFGYANIVQEKPEEFEKVLRASNAQSTIRTYLRKLTFDAMDMSTLDVPSIWREKFHLHGKDTEEAQKVMDDFQRLSEKANEYCAIFFGAEGLHPKVREEKDITELLNNVRNICPNKPEKYKIFAGSIAKLNIMHLVDYIYTKVSFPLLKAGTMHLKKKIDSHTERTAAGLELLCARDDNPDHSVQINSIIIADHKDEMAIARKNISRDLQFTKEFRLEDIKDLFRLSIILTEEDSRSQEKIDAAIKKVVGILIAMFGTDIPEDRLKYSIESGCTNGNSTGNHRAFHITFYYRIQCKAFGKNRYGSTVHDMIAVECQIKPFMFREQVEEDHEIYKKLKDEKIRKFMGMDVPYPEFIRNLCEAIIYYDKLPDTAKRTESGFERNIKEKWVMTLLSMIIMGGEFSGLENEYTIRKICEDPILVKKVRMILDRYAEEKSSIVTQQMEDIAEMRKPGQKNMVARRYKSVLAKSKRILDVIRESAYAKVNNSSKAEPVVEAGMKIEKMSQEGLVDGLMATFGGWREKIHARMKNGEERPEPETGINILAKRARQIIDAYARTIETAKDFSQESP